MSIIINQPQGLGDIIFCMPIAQHLISIGHKEIIWPVNSVYANIGKHFPDIIMPDIKDYKIDYNRRDVYQADGKTVIPLRFSDTLTRMMYHDCMRSKYVFAGLDMELWRTCKFERDRNKEIELFKMFGISNGEKYALVNPFFKTSTKGKVVIQKPNMRCIDMRNIEGFTMIDWSLIILNAAEIHTVGTSINYLIELLQPKCDVHLYVRRPDERDFKNYDYILSDRVKYIFHN